MRGCVRCAGVSACAAAPAGLFIFHPEFGDVPRPARNRWSEFRVRRVRVCRTRPSSQRICYRSVSGRNRLSCPEAVDRQRVCGGLGQAEAFAGGEHAVPVGPVVVVPCDPGRIKVRYSLSRQPARQTQCAGLRHVYPAKRGRRPRSCPWRRG